jgi:putative membrane protein
VFEVTTLPPVNAALNGVAAVLLATGYVFVRRGNVARHRACMVSALVVSALFLVSYVVYHFQAGSRPFTGTGPVRFVYFFVLITHVVLAALNVPLVLITVSRAVRGEFERHRAIARWTYPVWLYVSISGVAVYLMLYRL